MRRVSAATQNPFSELATKLAFVLSSLNDAWHKLHEANGKLAQLEVEKVKLPIGASGSFLELKKDIDAEIAEIHKVRVRVGEDLLRQAGQWERLAKQEMEKAKAVKP